MVVRRVIATLPPQVFSCNGLFPAMREAGGWIFSD